MSTVTVASASSKGAEDVAILTMPRLSPSASLKACPNAIATSSTVWWPSGSIVAEASTRRSFTPCRASCASMWSSMVKPVETSERPVPSTSISTATVVSPVSRRTVAERMAG